MHVHRHADGRVRRRHFVCCKRHQYFCCFGCSKARRGTVTHILMNLCSALTTLLAVLYLAAVFAHSRLGCRVANVCRYYLVLVSLCWNGIEAHNMYRMLVKVFNTAQQTHFVLKAAVVAWGSWGSRCKLNFFSNILFVLNTADPCLASHLTSVVVCGL